MADYSYPPVGFHFRVEFALPGVTDNDTRFKDVSGLSASVEMDALPEGGENRFTHQLPKGVSYTPVKLQRGMVTDSAVIGWVHEAIANFQFNPVDVTISLLNEKHEPLRAWTLINAFPKSWSISDFNATDNNLVIETLELQYQYYKISGFNKGLLESLGGSLLDKGRSAIGTLTGGLINL